jgi:hypothetical protein
MHRGGQALSLDVCLLALAVSSSLATARCATYEDELVRGQRAFEQSEDERALAIFRALEPDAIRLPAVGRAQYAYLRGMTDYRIGYRSEARHWLAIASALDEKTPGSLPPDWEKRMSESLKELNEEVYAGGVGQASGGGASSEPEEAGAAREPAVPSEPAAP